MLCHSWFPFLYAVLFSFFNIPLVLYSYISIIYVCNIFILYTIYTYIHRCISVHIYCFLTGWLKWSGCIHPLFACNSADAVLRRAAAVHCSAIVTRYLLPFAPMLHPPIRWHCRCIQFPYLTRLRWSNSVAEATCNLVGCSFVVSLCLNLQ